MPIDSWGMGCTGGNRNACTPHPPCAPARPLAGAQQAPSLGACWAAQAERVPMWPRPLKCLAVAPINSMHTTLLLQVLFLLADALTCRQPRPNAGASSHKRAPGAVDV